MLAFADLHCPSLQLDFYISAVLVVVFQSYVLYQGVAAFQLPIASTSIWGLMLIWACVEFLRRKDLDWGWTILTIAVLLAVAQAHLSVVSCFHLECSLDQQYCTQLLRRSFDHNVMLFVAFFSTPLILGVWSSWGQSSYSQRHYYSCITIMLASYLLAALHFFVQMECFRQDGQLYINDF